MLSLILAVALAAGTKVEVLAFKATWCAPCRAAEPKLKALEVEAKKHPAYDFKIKRVDVDKDPKLATKYGVETLPHFVVLVNSKKVYVTGDVDDLVSWLKKIKNRSR